MPIFVLNILEDDWMSQLSTHKKRNFDTSYAFHSSCSQVLFSMTGNNQKLISHNQNFLRKFLFLVFSANYLSTDKELKNSISDVTFQGARKTTDKPVVGCQVQSYQATLQSCRELNWWHQLFLPEPSFSVDFWFLQITLCCFLAPHHDLSPLRSHFPTLPIPA